MGDNAKEFTTSYGNISAASVGAIQRGLMQVEAQGGDRFFGEPMLNIQDFLQTDEKGHGVVNILAADKLLNSPRLYATFLLWMLSELFEQLPEIGDPEKPKLVFFFDEAHLLFDEAPKVLVEKHRTGGAAGALQGRGRVFRDAESAGHPGQRPGAAGQPRATRPARLHPARPESCQGHGADHAAKPGLDIETAITELATGEALLSLLDVKGRPSITERAYVIPPGSQIGPITAAQRQALIANSLVAGAYEKTVDRESAYEKLNARTATMQAPAAGGATATAPGAPAAAAGGGLLDGLRDAVFGSTGPRGGKREGLAESMAKSAVRSVGSALGREIMRGVLGGLTGTRRR